jgi:hypothetical protein
MQFASLGLNEVCWGSSSVMGADRKGTRLNSKVVFTIGKEGMWSPSKATFTSREKGTWKMRCKQSGS